MRRRDFLIAVGGAAAAGAGAALGLRRPVPAAAGDDPLRVRAARRGIVFGAAAGWATLRDDPAFAAALARECALVVPENDLKWARLAPDGGPYRFQDAEAVLDFARRHGMSMRGHPLVWHDALPGWLRPERIDERVLTDHVGAVVRRFAGRVGSWDVVNEAVRAADGRPDGLRRSPWLARLGPGYLETAFHAAHQADPAAQLVYNEHGVEYAVPEERAQRRAVLALLERLLRAGAPVHALGIQGHLVAGEKRFAAGELRGFLREVASMGLRLLVTELDVVDRALPAGIAARDRRVADEYLRFLEVVLDEPAVTAVLTWGLSDRHSWISGFRRRADGLPVRPLPLDAELRRKPAWTAIARALDGAPAR